MAQEHFTRSDYDILLLHVLKNRTIFLDYVTKTDEPVFDPALYLAHDFIDRVIREMYFEHKDYISPAVVSIRMKELLEKSSLDEELKQQVLRLFDNISEIPEKHLQPELAGKILSRIIDSQIMRSASDKIKLLMERGQYSSGNFLKELSLEKERRKIGLSSEVRLIQPFEEIEKYLIEGEVFPTGVEFVDILLRGGPWRHDLLGLLAPSGGGKTTFAIQLSTSWLRQDPRRNAVLFSYEQPLEGDISSRLCSSITGLPVTEFRGKSFDQLTEEARNRYIDKHTGFKNRFHFVDMSGGRAGTGGIDDIKSILNRLSLPQEGPPTLVVIDWFLPCIQRSMLGAGAQMDSERLRLFSSRFMDDLKILKNTSNIVLMVTHQLNCEKAGAGAARKPVWTDAAEWKGFAWYADVCFAIGTLSEEYVCWFCASKTRSTASSERMVQLVGDHVKFVEAKGFHIHKNTFKPKVQVMEELTVDGAHKTKADHLTGLDKGSSQFIEDD